MVKKYSSSQIKSKLRQAQSKTRQAVNNYNRAVNNYNNAVKKTVNEYNQFVRKFNSQVRLNRTKINSELRKLQSYSNQTITLKTSVRTTYYTSVNTLNSSYQSVTSSSDYLDNLTPVQEKIYDLIEKENANNLITSNAILNDENYDDIELSETDVELKTMLSEIAEDLGDRWKGALFSLNPNNPDATRHFCTSSREIFTEILEIKASDEEVFKSNPTCVKTDRGNATRRERISYLIHNKGLLDTVTDFVSDDIDNVLELFHVLSDGTHGESGKYSTSKLNVVRKRVEDGLYFLCGLAL